MQFAVRDEGRDGSEGWLRGMGRVEEVSPPWPPVHRRAEAYKRADHDAGRAAAEKALTLCTRMCSLTILSPLLDNTPVGTDHDSCASVLPACCCSLTLGPTQMQERRALAEAPAAGPSQVAQKMFNEVRKWPCTRRSIARVGHPAAISCQSITHPYGAIAPISSGECTLHPAR